MEDTVILFKKKTLLQQNIYCNPLMDKNHWNKILVIPSFSYIY